MTADQHFLLLFIFCHYFGPDLKDERPRKSVFQRIVEGLPPYTTHELAGSRLRTLEVERVYYYVLRMAKKSDIVERETLHKFLNYGCLHSPSRDSNVDLGQFPQLFPPHLHRQYRFEDQYQVIENIVLINKPNTSFINTVVAMRFKKLTGLEFFFLDAEAALSYCRICGIADNMIEELDDEELAESSLPRSREMGMGNLRYVRPLRYLSPYNNSNNTSDNSEVHNNVTPLPTDMYNLHDESGMVFYPSDPTAEEWSEFVDAARKAIGFEGIAVEIPDGPLISLLDIRACEDAYWFRILLPGVKPDGKFVYSIKDERKMILRGVTVTGWKMLVRQSRQLDLQRDQLCPPGEFSVVFQLPGPVESKEMTSNLGSDGVFVGVVKKKVEGCSNAEVTLRSMILECSNLNTEHAWT
ncbi:increased DNA methylation 2-like protein [Cinnamomum micranthum f. kanehirae]|uniref:Increased DNA methylation 2-like protein n=1 Tax=Cinnamomum micranthum f. kanehirae TaxID=337451 RepID=A0A443PSL1_9MAGN|nr:increased DNA methylation 2-like protein [Cinnamomum micranthum f. kanehirae]